MLSKDENIPDVILDIKYKTSQLLRPEEAIAQLESMEEIYHLSTRRKSIPLILLVVTDTIKERSENSLKKLIADKKIILISEEEVKDWNPYTIIK